MNITELFLKPIDRPINGVIKADQMDAASVWQELEEYVVTKQISEYLRKFFDAYLAAIDRPQDAALFALELRDRFGRIPWADLGLPADLGIRLVLHAGPVFTFADPVLGRSTCLGSHISRAARIEPITPPGQVFASQEFAALCSADDLAAVSFEFLGRIHTGRLFDEAPLYRLDRRRREL